jgi:DNA polymerase-3 subunit gamma/tau
MDSILTTEEIAHTEQALLLLGRKADGSIRDGLSLLDQVIAYSASNIDEDAVSSVLGLVDDAFFMELLDSIGSNNFEGILGQVEVIFDRGYDLQEMAQGFNVTIRDAIISLETSDAAVTSKGILVPAPDGMTSTDLMALLQIGLETEAQLRYARQPRVLLEHQWLKMAALDRTVSIQQLITDMGNEPSPAGRSQTGDAPAGAAAALAPPAQLSTTEAKPEPVEQSSPRRSFRRGVDANEDPAANREPARTVSTATADQVRGHWSEIQSDIALKSAATAAMLEGSELEDLDDGRIALHLRASEAIHLDMIAAKRKMLEEIIAARLGQRVNLVPTIPESALPADSGTGTSGAGDAALEKLIDTFSGEDY